MPRPRSLPRRVLVESSWALDADRIPRPIRAGTAGELVLTTREGVRPIELGYIIRDIGDLVLTAWLPETPANHPMRFYLDPRPLRFGGARTYLMCPGCGKRVLKLYLPFVSRDGFMCRECHGLAYRSSSMRRRSMADLRAIAARARDIVERPRPPLPSLEAELRRVERLKASAARKCASG